MILLFFLSSVCASFIGMSQAILFQSVQATPQRRRNAVRLDFDQDNGLPARLKYLHE